MSPAAVLADAGGGHSRSTAPQRLGARHGLVIFTEASVLYSLTNAPANLHDASRIPAHKAPKTLHMVPNPRMSVEPSL